MALSLKKILSNNAPLKIFSLILGYLVWSVFSSGNTTTITKKIPLCFYNAGESTTLIAPETLTVTLAGKRADLYSLDYDALAIHLNAKTMQKGTNPIQLTKDTLFLPETIKLVHYKPVPLVVEMTKQ